MADGEPKVVIVPGPSEASNTFIVEDEDHTLGNALRYVIMRNPETSFCGYTIPHPSESRIYVRVQTKGAPATEVFKQGLRDVVEATNVLESAFDAALARRH